jgi:hypothetical protein
MLIDKLVKQVQSFNLNLTAKTVLTETASGAYVVTLLIAAIAGAKVFAYSRTTAYGTADDIFSITQKYIDDYKYGRNHCRIPVENFGLKQ